VRTLVRHSGLNLYSINPFLCTILLILVPIVSAVLEISKIVAGPGNTRQTRGSGRVLVYTRRNPLVGTTALVTLLILTVTMRWVIIYSLTDAQEPQCCSHVLSNIPSAHILNQHIAYLQDPVFIPLTMCTRHHIIEKCPSCRRKRPASVEPMTPCHRKQTAMEEGRLLYCPVIDKTTETTVKCAKCNKRDGEVGAAESFSETSF
jgi:hypothetical protein